ncbi:hypothetical protein [Zwartia sp.]|uniref:hypothetical protein n=1 Tax=Zwartia sp. TaxID=2978004 RepID=UPI0027251826|nr:hypothetical protein [Zwartia sp.]MDO9025296.1 hypothetical protein [Zwartia sp.]
MGVMTSAEKNNGNGQVSLSYIKLISETLGKKSAQYQEIGAINRDQSAEQLRKGTNDQANVNTRSNSFVMYFDLARNKFGIR